MPAYPASLPAPLIGSLKESKPDLLIRTSMDAAVDKVRRRYSQGATKLSYQIILEESQVSTLDTFYTTTIKSGSLTFDYTHPRTGASVTARWINPPTYELLNYKHYKVTVELEILP